MIYVIDLIFVCNKEDSSNILYYSYGDEICNYVY